MYSDKKKSPWPYIIFAAAMLILCVSLYFGVFRCWQQQRQDEAAQRIRQTIQSAALQCYTVEGVYPPSLDYLQENYGLQINTDDFTVVYDAIASNLPPDVRVAVG